MPENKKEDIQSILDELQDVLTGLTDDGKGAAADKKDPLQEAVKPVKPAEPVQKVQLPPVKEPQQQAAEPVKPAETVQNRQIPPKEEPLKIPEKPVITEQAAFIKIPPVQEPAKFSMPAEETPTKISPGKVSPIEEPFLRKQPPIQEIPEPAKPAPPEQEKNVLPDSIPPAEDIAVTKIQNPSAAAPEKTYTQPVTPEPAPKKPEQAPVPEEPALPKPIPDLVEIPQVKLPEKPPELKIEEVAEETPADLPSNAAVIDYAIFYPHTKQEASEIFTKNLLDAVKKTSKKPFYFKRILKGEADLSTIIWEDLIKKCRERKLQAVFVLHIEDFDSYDIKNKFIESGIFFQAVSLSQLERRITYVDLVIEFMLTKKD